MAKFTARTTAPSKDNAYYYSNNIFYNSGYGMPNCTAYAWGRLYELTKKRYMNLIGNAEDWWAAAEKAGLDRGQTPKLGAIICWRAGTAGVSSDGAGHVAVIEEIKPNGDIVTSNSAWQGTNFYMQTLTKASGYMYSSNRPLQGFIYCGIEFEDETADATTSNDGVVAGKMVILDNTRCYTSESSASNYDRKSGTFYLWDASVRNGRIRITNSKARVGVLGQVTCWVRVADLGLTATENATEIYAGKKITLKGANAYSSESGAAYGTKTGTYYLWDAVVKNKRIRITNKESRVGKTGQVTCWIDISSIN